MTITQFPTRVSDLRIEHVTYNAVEDNRFIRCNVTNVMFTHNGKRMSSRYHYHLSKHEAEAMVKRSLERKKK